VSAPSPRPARTQIYILLSVFFAPLALAFLLYYGSGGWRPPGSTNHGVLISPPQPLPSVELPTPAGPPLQPQTWRGKWTLLYVADGRCDEQCRAALTLMRQTRLALNTDMTRVQRIFLATGNWCDQAYLDAEHPGLMVALADNDAGTTLLAAFPDARQADGSGSFPRDYSQSAHADRSGTIYVVDPLGNLMMRHAPQPPPAKGLLEDLRKLLKLSHIG
jgi:cytochrome oxidase Cu insertion factor (SCO1/SenC/PrrC family)